MAQRFYNKGDRVSYSTGSALVEAQVERVHRDNTATVLARFYLADSGKRVPGYLGFKFRLSLDDMTLLPVAVAA